MKSWATPFAHFSSAFLFASPSAAGALAADTAKTAKRLSDMSCVPAADQAKAVASFLKDMKKSTGDLNKAAKDAKSSYDAAVRTGVKADIAKKLGEYVKASAVAAQHAHDYATLVAA